MVVANAINRIHRHGQRISKVRSTVVAIDRYGDRLWLNVVQTIRRNGVWRASLIMANCFVERGLCSKAGYGHLATSEEPPCATKNREAPFRVPLKCHGMASMPVGYVLHEGGRGDCRFFEVCGFCARGA